ncbi:MAG TPA: TIGR02996 domain-containing protein [Candidatus Xenobia bacterium]
MTTEPIRDGLLAAIRENPDDDTPRLILADWLGKPNWKRGSGGC